MTVLENVLVGAHTCTPGDLVRSLLLPMWLRPWERRAHARALGLLRFVGLAERANDLAGALPFADQRRLEIARALAADPDLLILDEPAAGMHPTEVRQLVALVQRVRSLGITVLLIEHHMEVVTELADRVTVLNFGRVIAEGPPEQIAANREVIEAYLGEERREEPERVVVPAASARAIEDGAAIAPMLSIRALRVLYGGAPALDGVDLDVYPGEVVALIGANGAGKTTTLKTISGVSELLKSVRGEITFLRRAHRPLARARDRTLGHRARSRGTARVPGIDRGGEPAPRRVRVVAIATSRPTSTPCTTGSQCSAARRHQPAGLLSGGEQQMLAFGRALTARPRVLLLDEPSLGLAPIIVDEVFDVLRGLAAEHVTILLVEQLATRALALADRAYILETGRIVKTGNAHDLARDPEVTAAYLGG